MTTRELVHNAAKLMDEKLPGWECNVDPDALNQCGSSYCVLGQGTKDAFSWGWMQLFPLTHVMDFESVPGSRAFSCDHVQEGLTAAWCEELATRKMLRDAVQAKTLVEVK